MPRTKLDAGNTHTHKEQVALTFQDRERDSLKFRQL